MMVRAIALVLLAAISQPTAEWDQWRTQRRARLLSEDGWLTLVGLYWLHEGTNNIPPLRAQFVLKNGHVTLLPGTPLRDDTDPKGPTIIRSGTLSYQVIKRGDVKGDRFGIRAKDTKSEARKNFKGLDYFAFSPAFRVTAHFEPYKPPRKIAITNVLGMTSDETSPGALVFKLNGRPYQIDPILEQGETDLFIIFKDATSGRETYGAARYLYAHPPDANGNTVVDFNKSYNPPCVFTPYATCPLPPPQNRLPIRVEAGEKKYAGHA
ncbi:MAG TPA: DUF1684 domain-containing protein [Thermoanaerobaculia bacterium]|nr:DUF1684 domain-containing protein [Thermoanaerobaculia bacterium]